MPKNYESAAKISGATCVVLLSQALLQLPHLLVVLARE